jgi:hypothetical protein
VAPYKYASSVRSPHPAIQPLQVRSTEHAKGALKRCFVWYTQQVQHACSIRVLCSVKVFFLITVHFKMLHCQALVVHACNPSFLGGTGSQFKASPGKVCEIPFQQVRWCTPIIPATQGTSNRIAVKASLEIKWDSISKNNPSKKGW